MPVIRTTTASYTALIRWRGPDPAVEIETRHPGFYTPEDAALFANGISSPSPVALHLFSNGSIHLGLNDGRDVPFLTDAVILWILPAKSANTNSLQVVNDDDFHPTALAAAPTLQSAHGDYEQAQYGVLDRDDSPISVIVDWDESDHLRVTVEEDSPSPERLPTFVLGSLPQA